VSNLLQDLRYGVRSLAGSPGLTCVILVTLALGIGATTSIYSVADAVLFSPLPYPEPDRLVRLYSSALSDGLDRSPVSGADFLDWREQSRTFEHLVAFSDMTFNLAGGDYPRRVWGAEVTPGFFDMMGVAPLMGRRVSSAIDGAGSPPVVVLSHELWQSEFDGDTYILGREIALSGKSHTAIGVMPPGFDFPFGTQLWIAAQHRVPAPAFGRAGSTVSRDRRYLITFGRLKDDVSLEEARAEMTTIADRIAQAYPDTNSGTGILLVPLRESIVGGARPVLYMFLGAVLFLLLIACANVANLLLVRASRRGRDIAIRTALGAGRLRIASGLIIEGILIGLGGGALGVLATMWGTDLLLALLPGEIPRLDEIQVNARVLGFALLVALGTGLLFGLAPMLQILSQDVQAVLREGSTSHTAGRIRTRLRGALIMGEVAVSLLLLVGAGLMMRTFVNLTAVDPGFNPARTVAAHVVIPSTRYREPSQVAAFYRQVLERLESVPGIASAGAAFSLPLHMNVISNRGIVIEGRPDDGADGRAPGYQVVSHGYFRTLGIPLVRGRLFTHADDEEAPRVALINERLERHLWPGEDPIGRRITWDDPDEGEVEWVTIVGVVADTVHESLAEGARPEVYRPYLQAPIRWMTFVVRGERDTAALAPAVRSVVQQVDPEQPVSGVRTMEQVIASSLDPRRFNMQLLGAFALVSLSLAGLGLYGVVSFSVSQRSREIGIRKALGAQAHTVIVQILREGLRLAAGGVVLGALAGLILTRLISSLVHGVSPVDPVSYGLAIVVLLGIALVACYLPAARASRVDPVAVLRQD
jgi:putative ABC transport system permease protein